MCKSAFTLIELLIVIAIIAILALIAIPNFLDAQVRARVARVYSDMRALGTAVEAYAVDYNMPPMGGQDCKLFTGGNRNSDAALRTLSTPVSYITKAVMYDPFAEKGFYNLRGGNPAKGNYRYESFTHPDLDNASGAAKKKGYRWYLASVGPSRNNVSPKGPGDNVDPEEILSGWSGLWVYDPTNGTVSFGNILRTNKGVFTGSQYNPK